MVTASGAPGTAALLHALRENGEREVRLVGTDMSERAVGKHLCDAFHIVPGGADPTFADAMLAVAERENVDAILPQSSFDLEGLATSGGPACHAGVAEPSSTLVAMWREHPAEHWRLEGPVRFSLPPWTSAGEVDRAIEIVERVIGRGAAALFGAASTASSAP